MKTIKFYRLKDPYGEFSNFSPHGIYVDNKFYPTSEHYYQSQKFIDVQTRETIRHAATPRIAADLGRTLPNLRFDWDDIKEDVMLKALQCKFTQHNNLKELLLSTKDSYIVEDSKTDSYWGVGADGNGKNMLGKLLMNLRASLTYEISNNRKNSQYITAS